MISNPKFDYRTLALPGGIDDITITPASSVVYVGDFFEELTKNIFGGKRLQTEPFQLCPDLMIARNKYCEVKAAQNNGRPKWIIYRKQLTLLKFMQSIYWPEGKEIRKKDSFEFQIYYALWLYSLKDVKQYDSRDKLRDELAASEKILLFFYKI